MTRYYIDTSTYNDFDSVIRYLKSKGIAIADRDKAKMVVSAELTPEQLDEVRKLPLEEVVSIGTSPLL